MRVAGGLPAALATLRMLVPPHPVPWNMLQAVCLTGEFSNQFPSNNLRDRPSFPLDGQMFQNRDFQGLWNIRPARQFRTHRAAGQFSRRPCFWSISASNSSGQIYSPCVSYMPGGSGSYPEKLSCYKFLQKTPRSPSNSATPGDWRSTNSLRTNLTSKQISGNRYSCSRLRMTMLAVLVVSFSDGK